MSLPVKCFHMHLLLKLVQEEELVLVVGCSERSSEQLAVPPGWCLVGLWFSPSSLSTPWS